VSFKGVLDSDREDKYLGKADWLSFFFFNCCIFYRKVSDCQIYFSDVIGHVVERDEIKDKEINGPKSRLLDITLEDSE